MKTVGVLGGSFNPIHNAHLAMAKCAHKLFNIPEILIMPTASTYYKDEGQLTDAKKRMDMIRLAIDEIGAGDYMKPSYIDLDRGGITYTYDTISELESEYDIIYFIIGTDSLMYIDKWVKADLFLPKCILLVSMRPGDEIRDVKEKVADLKKLFGARIEFLDTKINPVSSSEIRKMIKGKKTVSGLLPESVIKYIMENNLYSK